MLSKSITLTGTPSSLASLVQPYLPDYMQDMVGDRDDLKLDVVLQSPATNADNIFVGDSSDQSGFIVPSGGIGISRLNLNRFYIHGTNGEDVIVLLIF